MKLPSTAIYAALLLLSLASAAWARSPEAKGEKIRAMMKDRGTAHMAFDETLKDRENKRHVAKVLAKDKEFRELYGSEIGSDAPQQERNPSQHPELFRSKQ